MKTSLRLATLALVASGALAVAGNAFATQTMTVTQTASALTIKVAQPQSDPQPAKITIYVPSTNQLTATQAPNTTIGKTTGHVFARDLGIPLPLSGNVIVLDPTLHTMDPCDPGNHLAVWDLQLSVAGQTINLPVYVSQTTGAETALGAAKLVVCLGPADVPAGTANRSPMGAQLLDATFTVNNVVTPTAASSEWPSTWTPYGVGSAVPNDSGTVQVLSVVGPGNVTIKAQVLDRKRKKVKISGRVTQAGMPVNKATVNLLLNSRARNFGKLKTNAAGAYAIILFNIRKSVTITFFQAVATSLPRDVTASGCASAPLPGVPCASATASGFTARSKKIKLVL